MPVALSLVLCVLSALVALARPVRAANTLAPAAIEQAAEAAVRARAGTSAGTLQLAPAPLDARLRLPECDRPLEATIPGDGQVHGQTTVAVRCAGRVHWTIYTSIDVATQARVLVTRYALPLHAMLTAADFQSESRRLPGLLSGYVTDPSALTGQRLDRPLGAGEPLPIEALAPAPLIRRGQQVVLVARGDGIEVRAAAVALDDGRAADRIQVRNLSSQRIVEGIVRSAGVVEAPL